MRLRTLCPSALSAGFIGGEQLVGSDRGDNTVYWFLSPVFGEEDEEPLPLLLIHAAILGDSVAAGRVEDDRLLEEPPVARARG